MSSDSDSSMSGSEADWEDAEASSEVEEFVCLFCCYTDRTAESLFLHMESEHKIDLPLHCCRLNLDMFLYIKLINYIRKEVATSNFISSLHRGSELPWMSDDYMKPTLPQDSLLRFDMEYYIQENNLDSKQFTTDVNIDAEVDRTAQLEAELHKVKEQNKELEGKLQTAVQSLSIMRNSAAQNFLSVKSTSPTSDDNKIANLNADEDEGYFGCYSHFSIHQEMLQDKVRTESYRDSIYNNKDKFKDKVVLDVGCGTGILSMFAARAGARKVFAVDMSDIAYQAMDIVRENKLDNVITVLKGKIEEIQLPVEKVDIIISEWMGYFLLFESMLDSVLYARDRYLSPDGILLPDSGNICLVGEEDHKGASRHLHCWADMYGFSMSCMRTSVIAEPFVQVVEKEKTVTDSAVVKVLDLQKCLIKELDFSSPFKLTASKDTSITAIVGYFDITFSKLPNPVYFSTSPQHTPTHWKQTVFLLNEAVILKQDECLEGTLNVRKNPKDPRSLKVTITIQGKKQVYLLQ